jgi:hypothetical protein
MCDRAEAQVLRLSMLYSLLDGSAVIRAEHLYAALALWRYAEESVLTLFRQATGDAVADTVLAALKSIHPGGLTREQLYKDVFQHHKKSDDIDRVIRSLSDKGYITVQHVSTGGRPREVLLYNKSCTESTESTERVPDYVQVAKTAVESYTTALHRKSMESAQKVHATDAPTLSVQHEQTFCANESPENSNTLPLSVLSVLSVQSQSAEVADSAHTHMSDVPEKGTISNMSAHHRIDSVCLHRHFDPDNNACMDCGLALDDTDPEESY